MAKCIICNGTGGVVGKISGTDLDCIFCGGTGNKAEDEGFYREECADCNHDECPPCLLDGYHDMDDVIFT